MVDILDSATFQQIQTLESPQEVSTDYRALAFSPDSRVLTCCSGGSHNGSSSDQELFVVSWDLQTGGITSLIKHQGSDGQYIAGKPCIAYSGNGKMVGVFYWYYHSTMILVHDVVSGVFLHSHLVGSPFSKGGPISNDIWIHGESLRFATAGRTTITIWEVGFASGSAPTELETISVPEDVLSAMPRHIDYDNFTERVRFLPASYRLAIAHQGQVVVWDTKNYKLLLSRMDIKCRPRMSFSLDGRFFACSTVESAIYLWRESPTGYILHETLESSARSSTPLLSPNGDSIIVFDGRTVQLWHTKSFTTPPSQLTRSTANFVLDFSPDGALAAVTRKGDVVVTVLDLKSGVPQLTIDASIEVYGLRLTAHAVVVIGDGKVITWNLHAGDHVPDARVGVGDSVRTMALSGRRQGNVVTAAISPDLHYIALTTYGFPGLRRLYVHSAFTGKYLGHSMTDGNTPWFTPDGDGIWCAVGTGEAEEWRIVGNWGYNSGLALAGTVNDIVHPPEGYPWGSSRYRTTDDGWVLGPDGRRLVMLPPPWQSYPVRRMWNGRFLVLLHGALPEPVILELEP